MRGITGWVGPRKVGGRYLCGYWNEEYTVVGIFGERGQDMMTVEWADGRQTTHCTAWDAKWDRVVSEPNE